MDLKDIEGSSNVTGVGYNPDTKVLRVRFRGGSLYDHHDFSPEDHESFMASDSKGSHYHAKIKGKFKTAKVPT